MSKQVKNNIKLAVCSVILAFLCVFIALLNRSQVKTIDFFFGKLPVSSFSGVATVLMMIDAIFMINIDTRKGFILSEIILTVQFISVFQNVFLHSKIESIPGVFMTAGIIGLMFMQYRYLNKMQDDERRLYELSVTDPLTGLYNRRNVREYIDKKIEDNEPFNLLFIDFDNFKGINDTFGHAYGDEILRETAKRWRGISDNDIYIARTGGDEFAMVIANKGDTESMEYAHRCLNVLSEKITVDGADFFATGSAGIARFPQDSIKTEELVKYADAAMYKAKRMGKNQLCLFDGEILDEIEKELKIENEIRSGLKENRFFLVFQPQYETDTKKLRGFESLLRLKDENGSIIPPSDFIPVAEKSGLILDIDRWVLKSAMETFKEQIKTKPDFLVSVNLSARHITEKGLATEIRMLLEETGFTPDRLEIEVTESCIIGSVDDAISTLSEVRALGVKVALDDFGTGYASLSYLQRLPVDLLKIDKSFVDNMIDMDGGDRFVSAIISIGHLFHCKVISEGVEEEPQLMMLRRLKCDYVQGYIWGKPQSYDEAVKLIA